MIQRFSDEVISKILDQSVFYQCACPAQVCKLINQQRDLFAYQTKCLDLTDTDRAVHQCIGDAVRRNHIEMEDCLEEILRLEGWDPSTYEMPEALKTRILAKI
jgi:hypothetical protein